METLMSTPEDRLKMISSEKKAEAFDATYKAYLTGKSIDFLNLWERREHHFNSLSEYMGYAFGEELFKMGLAGQAEQQKLECKKD